MRSALKIQTLLLLLVLSRSFEVTPTALPSMRCGKLKWGRWRKDSTLHAGRNKKCDRSRPDSKKGFHDISWHYHQHSYHRYCLAREQVGIL
jgi:hypothetical protein